MKIDYFKITSTTGLILVLLFSGCASKKIDIPPEPISQITPIIVYQDLDQNNHYLCKPGVSSCPNHRNENEIAILVSKTGTSLEQPKDNISCGVGTPDGFWALFGLDGRKLLNYQERLCASDYYTTSIAGTVFNQGLFLFYTLGTYIFTGGFTYHMKKFDQEYFSEATGGLRNIAAQQIPEGWYAIIDLHDLDSAHEITPQAIDGIIYTANNQFIALIPSSEHSAAILKILDGVGEARKAAQEHIYRKTLEKIPSVPVPMKIKQTKQLEKSEFETAQQFQARILKQENENRQKSKEAQEKYDVLYNDYKNEIEQLKTDYRSIAHDTDAYYDELHSKILSSQKQIALEAIRIAQGYYAVKDLRFDPEQERLHVKLFSNNEKTAINAYINIDAKNAKYLKKENGLKAYAEYKINNENIQLKAINISVNEKKFPIIYTSINYKPVISKAHLVNEEPIKTKQALKKIKIAQAKNIKSNPATHTYWQVDVIKRTNGVVPKWFSTPEISCGYGAGETLLDARAMALSQLAQDKNATVQVITQ